MTYPRKESSATASSEEVNVDAGSSNESTASSTEHELVELIELANTSKENNTSSSVW